MKEHCPEKFILFLSERAVLSVRRHWFSWPPHLSVSLISNTRFAKTMLAFITIFILRNMECPLKVLTPCVLLITIAPSHNISSNFHSLKLINCIIVSLCSAFTLKEITVCSMAMLRLLYGQELHFQYARARSAFDLS